MPSSFSFLSICLLLSLVLVHGNGMDHVANAKVTQSTLNKICSQTLSPSFCMKTLRSDPRTASANIYDLAYISIDIADKFAQNTRQYISSLIPHEASQESKVKYASCYKDYNKVIVSLNQAKLKLKSSPRDLQGMVMAIEDVNEVLGTCEDSFEVPPKGTPELGARGDEIESLILITLAISQFL